MPLLLPQAQIRFESERDDEAYLNCPLLVLGGRPPSPPWLSEVASGRVVWAADRGADVCMSSGVVPDRALGDFDSISKEGKAWLEGLGVADERFPADKDLTDFQLCLSRVKDNLLVTGCWGGRFDHAFANVFSALWGFELGARVLAFADESEVLIPLAAGERGNAQDGNALELRLLSEASVVSLLPLCEVCDGVDIRGTKWELTGVSLAQGRPYAVSNVPEKETLSVKIERGIVGVYCFFGREL